jgi:multiple sugar transport system permease protein
MPSAQTADRRTPPTTQINSRRRRPRRRLQRRSLLGLLFCLPLLILFGLLVYWPVVQGLLMSMRALDYSQGAAGDYVGLANYVAAIDNPDTRSAFAHTVEYAGFALGIEIIGGMVTALALNRAFPGRGIVLALLVLPWALPGVVSGVLWSRIFATDNGLLNWVLVRWHVIDHNHVWFSDQTTGIFLISVVHAWGVLPLTSLIMLAGLQGLPPDIYHAAQLDGAGWWRQFTGLTLPLMRPALAVSLTVGTTAALAIFDEIYVLNGKALVTRSVTMQIYQTTFVDLDFGQGTALAYLLTLATAIFGIGYVRSLRRSS